MVERNQSPGSAGGEQGAGGLALPASPVGARQEALPAMARPARSSLRVNISWTFLGNTVYALAQWGMLVVISKLGAPEAVGQFALALALTAPVMLLANLQLRIIQATDARREFAFADYLGLRLITVGLALLVIGGGALMLADYSRETALIVLALGLAKAVEAISDVLYGLLQQRERMRLIAISLMLKGAMSLLALGLGVVLTGRVFWGALGLALTWAGLLLAYDLPVVRATLREAPALASTPRWHGPTLLALSRLALPLGLVMMLLALNGSIPRYFIEHALGSYELGIFAALAYLMVAGSMVVNAIGEASSARLAQHYAAGEHARFVRLLAGFVGLGAALGGAALLGALLLGRQVLSLIYAPEYARQELLVWLMAAAALSYVASFLGYAMTAARQLKLQAPLFAAVTASTTLASWLLVPRYGLVGAALALSIAALVQIIGSLAILGRALGATVAEPLPQEKS